LATGLRFFALERFFALDRAVDFAVGSSDFLRGDFRLGDVTFLTAAVVDSPIDFLAALAFAARFPRAEPMLSATVVSNP